MEEFHMAAEAYYNNSSRELQQLARDFFRSMDMNGDGQVSLNEFLAFFRQSGYNGIDADIFLCLDRDGDGSLDFKEVLTLYYIMKTRGVWCDNCSGCLPGLYFTCVECFDSDNSSFDLCAECYSGRNFEHHHTNFLDTYVLLRSKKGLPPREANPNQAIVPRPHAANAPRRSSWSVAFDALETAVNIANNLGFCSIM